MKQVEQPVKVLMTLRQIYSTFISWMELQRRLLRQETMLLWS
jgi:hypothetical protein